ncbi:MAG: HIT family protein [Candidatus Bathyarchaeota archaeon]|nr:HIT family protein [Candidatus Bathyarchaeum sp.]
MSDVCPFCKIASGKAPASIVYQDDNVMAFMDLNPVNEGHTLIVPREHWENIYEVPEKTLAEMVAVVKRVSVAVKKTVAADGIKVIQLNGRDAGQVVMHIHIHVIPAISGSGATKGHHGRITLERKDLDETARRIRENF